MLLRFLYISLLFVFSPFLLSACSPNNSDLQEYIAKVKKTKPSMEPDVDTLKEYIAYSYQDDIRDPFSPPAPVKPPSVAVECHTSNSRNDILEQLPLNAISMVGVIQQRGVRWVLLQTNDGTVHKRKRNDHIGNKSGRIIRVTETSMEVQEIEKSTEGCVTLVSELSLNK